MAYINSTLFTSLLDECHLSSKILSSDTNLQIPGYNFARMDNPLDIRVYALRYVPVQQTKDEFENFIKNLELNFDHTVNKCPFPIVV